MLLMRKTFIKTQQAITCLLSNVFGNAQEMGEYYHINSLFIAYYAHKLHINIRIYKYNLLLYSSIRKSPVSRKTVIVRKNNTFYTVCAYS